MNETSSKERHISSPSIPLSIPPARKARPVAVFVATTAGVLLLTAATIWARYCDHAPVKASVRAAAPPLTGS